jgi:hypothetical protein
LSEQRDANFGRNCLFKDDMASSDQLPSSLLRSISLPSVLLFALILCLPATARQDFIQQRPTEASPSPPGVARMKIAEGEYVIVEQANSGAFGPFGEEAAIPDLDLVEGDSPGSRDRTRACELASGRDEARALPEMGGLLESVAFPAFQG